MKESDVYDLRMAEARAENPDVRELKKCRWATSSVHFAPCELPMGHKGRCYNGDRDRALKRRIAEAFDRDPSLADKLRAELRALAPKDEPNG